MQYSWNTAIVIYNFREDALYYENKSNVHANLSMQTKTNLSLLYTSNSNCPIIES